MDMLNEEFFDAKKHEEEEDEMEVKSEVCIKWL